MSDRRDRCRSRGTALAREPDLMMVDVRQRDRNRFAAVDTILKTRCVPHLFVNGDAHQERALHHNAVVLEKLSFVSELMRAIEKALGISITP